MSILPGLTDEWLLTLDDVSEQTRVVYERGVRQFTDWLAAHRSEIAPEEITREIVREWLRSLADAGRSKATRRVRLIALRLFLGYLVSEPDVALTANPAEGITLPEPEEHVVPVIADEDLTRLLTATDGASYVCRRDTAMIRLLLDTGCRRAELVGIDVEDVDLRALDVTLRRTKGGRPRVVPVSNKTALALRRFLRARQLHAAARSAPLFLSIRSGATGEWRMTGGAVAEMIKRRCESVDMAPINPHRFRHTWAHDQLANGANEGDVERLAGWRSPTMVRRYGSSAADERARTSARNRARGDRV